MRKVTEINDGWFFTKEEQKDFPQERGGEWVRVDLPHTWNADDGQDGGADYYRGAGFYFKHIYVSSLDDNRKYFLEFGAASDRCDVYVNKSFVGSHKGGYSAFRFEISKYMTLGNNEMAIMVCNSLDNNIYPQMADFTFYGGLYRKVKLIEVGAAHFQLDYCASEGIRVYSEIKEDGDAILDITAYVTDAARDDVTEYTVFDRSGEPVATAYGGADVPHTRLRIRSPHLWQGVSDPYLYRVRARLIRKNQVIDEVSVRHGFRSFFVHPQNGFYLNGIPTPLRGVSRHQDRLGKGNALSAEDHEEDARLIAETGANTVRLAHYQHSPEFYSLCDEYGFVVWAEIPFISRMNESPEAHKNCVSQLTELIVQAFNHTSICFWGVANEITIGGNPPKLDENLRDLDRLVKKLDPTRLSTIAQVSHLPMGSELNGITDLLAYNHYFGWYGGELSDNEKWFDSFHEKYPDRPIGISEYGCEGIILYHNDHPSPGDYSEEYQAVYHEHMLRLLETRPWIWGSYVWNMFDFGCDARDEGGVAGRNNKGLVTIDRKIRKDAFYLYKAFWSRIPTMHICGKRYYARGETVDIKVYTNQAEVRLLLDGDEIARSGSGDKIVVFKGVSLHGGANCITAVGGGLTDTAYFFKTAAIPECFTLKNDGADRGVTNWFDGRTLSENGDISVRDGYYSVKNTVRELLASDRAAKLITDIFSSISGMSLKSSMLMMMADQTPEEIIMGDLGAVAKGMDAGAVLATVNAELQKIPIGG